MKNLFILFTLKSLLKTRPDVQLKVSLAPLSLVTDESIASEFLIDDFEYPNTNPDPLPS